MQYNSTEFQRILKIQKNSRESQRIPYYLKESPKNKKDSETRQFLELLSKQKIEHTSSGEMAQTPGQSSRQFVHSISLLLSRSFKRGTGSQFCELIQIWNFSTWRLQRMSGWLVDGGGELRQPHFFPRVSTASSMTGNATIGHNYRSTGSYKSWHRKKSAIHPPTLTPQKWDAAKRNWRWQM